MCVITAFNSGKILKLHRLVFLFRFAVNVPFKKTWDSQTPVFRLVAYLLNTLLNTTTLIQNLIYIYVRFDIIWTQFHINFSRQEYQIDVLYISFNAWDSQVSAYTHFHFSFTVPLSIAILLSSYSTVFWLSLYTYSNDCFLRGWFFDN